MAQQFGMQMPARLRRGPSIGIYDGLLFLAIVAMIAAAAFLYQANTALSPDGSPFSLQTKGQVKLQSR